jgi:hypothetical protein
LQLALVFKSKDLKESDQQEEIEVVEDEYVVSHAHFVPFKPSLRTDFEPIKPQSDEEPGTFGDRLIDIQIEPTRTYRDELVVTSTLLFDDEETDNVATNFLNKLNLVSLQQAMTPAKRRLSLHYIYD